MELSIMPEIGKVIRDYRQKAGISQQKLGKIVGLQASQQQRVAEWENGLRTPASIYLLKLMAVLHIPPEAFDEYNNSRTE